MIGFTQHAYGMKTLVKLHCWGYYCRWV